MCWCGGGWGGVALAARVHARTHAHTHAPAVGWGRQGQHRVPGICCRQSARRGIRARLACVGLLMLRERGMPFDLSPPPKHGQPIHPLCSSACGRMLCRCPPDGRPAATSGGRCSRQPSLVTRLLWQGGGEQTGLLGVVGQKGSARPGTPTSERKAVQRHCAYYVALRCAARPSAQVRVLARPLEALAPTPQEREAWGLTQAQVRRGGVGWGGASGVWGEAARTGSAGPGEAKGVHVGDSDGLLPGRHAS